MRIEFQAPRSFELILRVWIGGAPKVTTRDDALEVGLLVLCATEYTAAMAGASWGDPWVFVGLVDDNQPPAAGSLRSIRFALAEAGKILDQGETVAFTCLAGKNRSCTLGALFLIERGWAPQEAIDVIRRARPGALGNHALNDLILGWPTPRRGGAESPV